MKSSARFLLLFAVLGLSLGGNCGESKPESAGYIGGGPHVGPSPSSKDKLLNALEKAEREAMEAANGAAAKAVLLKAKIAPAALPPSIQKITDEADNVLLKAKEAAKQAQEVAKKAGEFAMPAGAASPDEIISAYEILSELREAERAACDVRDYGLYLQTRLQNLLDIVKAAVPPEQEPDTGTLD